ncbi:hypothetical protein [Pseudonocardia sediminis]|uniref:hypothetical protein n=1 Tax=Pseudonocardia sediminis TaxID=1397368 RepID=UPI001F5E442E|nr:hypothetical protein [Pseudonocardia sediminis]
MADAAVALRRSAAGAGYAGLRGQYTGFALAGLLDSVSLQLDQVPAQVRRDALAAAGHLLDGPDGHHDPRTIGARPVTAGPGRRGR